MTEVENNNNNNNNKGPAFSEDLLRMYYARLFPYELFCQWLAYEPGPSPDPTKPLEKLGTRELCFTLKDDIYCRYQTFGCAAELKAMMLKKMPHKIDIGAVFNSPMRDHKSPSFRADERELVFDVDLSDYDDVRTCCQGATVCRKCWQFIVAAVKVLDAILRYDFGFDHLLWVYSGRRGVHCWVCDRVARELTNEARTALVSYCSLARSSDHAAALTWPLHPSLARAFDIVEPIFARDVVSDDGQQLLATPENWTKVLRRLPDDTAALIADHWATRDSTPAQKWAALKTQLRTTTTTTTTTANASDRSAAKKQKRAVVSDLWKYETVFAYVYPRLDDNVSKQRNHLLKAPFAAHPKTGRVCVPFDPTIVEDFDPCAVPTCVLISCFPFRKELFFFTFPEQARGPRGANRRRRSRHRPREDRPPPRRRLFQALLPRSSARRGCQGAPRPTRKRSGRRRFILRSRLGECGSRRQIEGLWRTYSVALTGCPLSRRATTGSASTRRRPRLAAVAST